VNADDLQIEYAKQQAEVESWPSGPGRCPQCRGHYSVRQEIERIEAEHAPASPDLGFGGMDMARRSPRRCRSRLRSGVERPRGDRRGQQGERHRDGNAGPAVESAAQRNLTA